MYANMKRMNNEMAVSPIVATLVLIVVAVIGAVAVGTIMGTFSTSVSKNVNANQANSASQTEILVAGSTTIDPITQAAAKVYSANNPGIKIDSQAVGSGAGIQAVGTGVADIGASSDGVSFAQQAQFPQLQSTLIGYGAIVPIEYYDGSAANSAWNPALSPVLTQTDLADIFQPGVNAASAALTGGHAAVVVYRADSSGTAKTFDAFIAGTYSQNGVAGFSQWTNCGDNYNSTAIAVNGNQAMIATVGTTKGAVGYADYGDAVTGVSGGKVWILPYNDGVKTYGFTQANSSVNTLNEWNALRTQAKSEYASAVETPGSAVTLSASNATLLRQLFYLTNGAPNSDVQNFISFVKNDPRDPTNANNFGVFQETNNFGIPDVA
jgi:phosphate transport system substrate-binding protein